jgi:hypothetical protein
MFICVDFDGTIVDHKYPEIGEPVPHALKWLKRFNQQGANLILFTMRSDGQKHGPVLTNALQYLKKNGIKLYAVNENPSQSSWTNSPKAYGNVYIDDSAVGCPLIHPKGFNKPCVDWEKVGRYIDSL